MEPLYIGGEYVESDGGGTIVVENPATEEPIAEVPDVSQADVDRVVAAARAAQPAWRRTDGLARAEILHECAGRLVEHRDELAVLLTREGGKTLKENADEVDWCVTAFRHLAEVGRARRGHIVGSTKPGQFNFVLRDPVGVCVHILPFNYPLVLLAWQVAAALATGNACIVKPSELTPLATLRLGEVFSPLPAGVFNVVTATGGGSAALVDHPNTDLIAFTGSVATGQRVMAACAPRIKKLLLELGGSDPFVVCADADLETAARGAVFGAFLNAGQVCTSTERLYVEDAGYDEFMHAFLGETAKLRIGDPFDDVDIGALVSRNALEQAERAVAEIVEAGGRVAIGAKRPEHLERGYFYEPSLLELADGAQHPSREIFGPLATVTRVRDLEEGIELANRTDFGLGANIYTSDLERAMRAADELRAGMVWINDPLKDNDAAPFGGVKMSGFGRELGPEGLDAFTEAKHVHLDYAQVPSPEWWFPYERPEIDVEAFGARVAG